MIPDDALHELLKLVRKSVPTPGKTEDTGYSPPPQPSSKSGSKPKKNKPMKGAEQEAQINRLKEQLNGFQERATALGGSTHGTPFPFTLDNGMLTCLRFAT